MTLIRTVTDRYIVIPELAYKTLLVILVIKLYHTTTSTLEVFSVITFPVGT